MWRSPFRVFTTFADKADKIDYKNMAAVDGAIAGALLATANSAEGLK